VKNKLIDCRNWTDITKIEQISSRSYTITPKQKITKTECKYQIAKTKGRWNTRFADTEQVWKEIQKLCLRLSLVL
jgi:hypothetical protein